MYEECEKLKTTNPEIKLGQLVDKWQYIYESKKGEISLVKFINYFHDNKDFWEIHELSNKNLFDDVERFSSKAKAEKRIKKLLQ